MSSTQVVVDNSSIHKFSSSRTAILVTVHIHAQVGGDFQSYTFAGLCRESRLLSFLQCVFLEIFLFTYGVLGD